MVTEREKTLEELVEQRTARLRAEVERAREEGRRAGLEEAASEALGWADPDSDGAEAFVRLAETLRARASKASKRGEAP